MDIKLNVVLPTFEGPLDLLLHLLEKNEVDIYDIPINIITTQFIDYIEQDSKMSLEATSEFVVMASHLLEIKSRMLLPIHEEDATSEENISEEDPRFALVQRLLEYKAYKEVASKLEVIHDNHCGVAFQQSNEIKRYAKRIDHDEHFESVDVQLLVNALNNVIMRIPEVDVNRRDFFKKLRRDVYTVEEKLDYLHLKFEEKTKWTFEDLVSGIQSKMELVIVFLALLELLKLIKLNVIQDTTYGSIILEREF